MPQSNWLFNRTSTSFAGSRLLTLALAVMKPSSVKFPFEYCALRYYLQWQQRESDLHSRIKVVAPELPDIRKALRYFQVARNFKGLKQDSQAQLVSVALLRIRECAKLSPEQKVLRLAKLFEDAGFGHNISAASKLLWLSNRSPYIIYDSRVFTALQGKFEHSEDQRDYQAYCNSWRKAYDKHSQEIETAVNSLPKVRAFLPGITPPDDLLTIVNKPWFRERVFDIYLWEHGGEGA